jgi:hypothetical protein
MSFWSEACQSQKLRPRSQVRASNYGGCIFAVSQILLLLNPIRHVLKRCADYFVFVFFALQRVFASEIS